MSRDRKYTRMTEHQLQKLRKKRRRNNRIKLIIFFAGLLVLFALVFFVVKSVIAFFGPKVDKKDSKTNTTTETTTETTGETRNETTTETGKENTNHSQNNTDWLEESAETENEIVTSAENVRVNTNKEPRKITMVYDKNRDLSYTPEDEKNLYENLPNSLKEKVDNYPESKNTTLLFEKLNSIQSEIDITKDFEDSKLFDRKVKLPYFSQWDERWGFRTVGGEYLSVSGCGPTSLSMIYIGLTGDTSKDPLYMAEYSYENGWYDASGGYPALFTEGPISLGLSAEYIDVSKEAVIEALEEGKVVLALVVNAGIGDFTNGGHFIIITEMDDEGNFRIYDSNSYQNTNKSWNADRVMSQVRTLYSIWK